MSPFLEISHLIIQSVNDKEIWNISNIILRQNIIIMFLNNKNNFSRSFFYLRNIPWIIFVWCFQIIFQFFNSTRNKIVQLLKSKILGLIIKLYYVFSVTSNNQIQTTYITFLFFSLRVKTGSQNWHYFFSLLQIIACNVYILICTLIN